MRSFMTGLIKTATLIATTVSLGSFTLVAQAQSAGISTIDVVFKEGAPKDRFIITNTGDCDIEPFDITIDLERSQGGLVFDVTKTGAGVEVFQPFELIAGKEFVKSVSEVKDGDNQVNFEMHGLTKGSSVAFTIDVDDTKGGREITVTGEEIYRGGVTVKWAGGLSESIFYKKTSTASMPIELCAD